MTKTLEIILSRASTWPPQAQEELLRVVQEIEEENVAGMYKASDDELGAIDEGLAQMQRGELVSEKEMDAFFKKRKP